ncbi:MAG: hypothetical protein U1E78_12240 [Gammaproteobacteria bacterium]
MNKKVIFGVELKRRVKAKQSLEKIGHWAYSCYLAHDDPVFSKCLLDLATMEAGSEFELTYEELNEIADSLIIDTGVREER